MSVLFLLALQCGKRRSEIEYEIFWNDGRIGHAVQKAKCKIHLSSVSVWKFSQAPHWESESVDGICFKNSWTVSPYKTPPVMTWKDRRSHLLCFYRNDEAMTEGAFKSMRLKGIDASKNKPFLLSADRARFFHSAAWCMHIQIFGAKSTAPNRKNAALQTKKALKVRFKAGCP